MNRLGDLLRFVDFLMQFRAIERDILVKGKDGPENDAEHVCTLALAAWWVNDTYRLGLSTEKLLQMSLAHDLVEVYAGDVSIYETDPNLVENKKSREHRAFEQIRKEFPTAVSLHQCIEEYEAQESEEAKCVRALDTIIPLISIYLDSGRYWKERGVSLEREITSTQKKGTSYPPLANLYHEVHQRMRENEGNFFN